jgi:LAS superfamily LD-carboxypeptidase LdcB
MKKILLIFLLVLISCSREKVENMSERIEDSREETSEANAFLASLENNFSKRNINIDAFCDQSDEVELRVLREYGAVFLAAEKVVVPCCCMFKSEEEVKRFQDSVKIVAEQIGDTKIELQEEAMKAYLAARAEAQKEGLSITPRSGAEAARRSFADTLRLWNSRFEPACDYWKQQGKLTEKQVSFLKSLPIKEQVREVLRLEEKGIFFNKRFNGSILHSVAAPGTSQHLSMLALDIEEYDNGRVRKIMNKHGWFRTVRNDEPHFTFLGRSEEELPKLGLKKVNPDFWIPDF